MVVVYCSRCVHRDVRGSCRYSGATVASTLAGVGWPAASATIGVSNPTLKPDIFAYCALAGTMSGDTIFALFVRTFDSQALALLKTFGNL